MQNETPDVYLPDSRIRSDSTSSFPSPEFLADAITCVHDRRVAYLAHLSSVRRIYDISFPPLVLPSYPLVPLMNHTTPYMSK